MTRSLLLRLAAALTLLTCLGHTIGTFMPIPPEQVAMHETIDVMKKTMIPMPVGTARSYRQILDGNNLCTSLFLLLCGTQLIVISNAPKSKTTDRMIIVSAIGLLGFTIISAFYFFPVPTVFTGFAAVLSLFARPRAAKL
jgi:hypothetical protein